MRFRQIKHFTRALTIIAGGVLAIAIGLACLRFSFAEPLARLSYNLPFILRSNLETDKVILVYLDEESAKQLHQPIDDVWNRALHVSLLDRLTQENARLVFYDIVFDQPARDPAADVAFADSIRRNGKVILGATLDKIQRMGGVSRKTVAAPTKPLRKAAAGWGILAFDPVDPDYGVREIFFGTSLIPSATWKAAQVLGASITRESRETAVKYWVNYYGPRDTFPSINFGQALDPEGLPPGYFKDKIVLIGGRSTVSSLAVGRDEFATPYSTWNHQFSPGLEIHATILLNLLRGEWLTRMSENWESILVVVTGLLVAGLCVLRPTLATLSALLASVAIGCCACWIVWGQRIWFDWMVPAAVQIPFGLVWSVGSQYLLESRRRKELRRAFAFYLSPEMANKIANSDFDLRPGGKLVEATVIFTDLENFTSRIGGSRPHGSIRNPYCLLWADHKLYSQEQGYHH